MSFPDGSRWSLVYQDPKSDTRMLTSLPSAMLRDAQLLAAHEGVSVAELVRRLLTEALAHSGLPIEGQGK